MTMEATIEDEEASQSRMAAYALARNEWQCSREKWSQATKTAAYESLTCLWFAMTGAEQAISGLRARLSYH